MRDLAAREMQDDRDPRQMLELGDQWWDYGERKTDAEQRAFRRRAAHWYALALPGVPDGLLKVRAEKRLDEIEEDLRLR